MVDFWYICTSNPGPVCLVAIRLNSARLPGADPEGPIQFHPQMAQRWMGHPVLSPADFTPVCTTELGAGQTASGVTTSAYKGYRPQRRPASMPMKMDQRHQ